MGNKFVTVDGSNLVEEAFDEDNDNVPAGALPITDIEFDFIRANTGRPFSDFEIVAGSVQLVANIDDVVKTRKINTLVSNPAFRAFAELMIDELNILRTRETLPDRTMAQFKTAMKAKLI